MLASAALVIYAAALVGAAASDAVRYEIPNSLSLALGLAFLLVAPALPISVLVGHFTAAAAVFAATAVFFAFGFMGGGDAKLLAATAVWIGWRNLPAFLLAMALAGAVIALILLVLRRIFPVPDRSRWYGRALSRDEGVPYGVAIAAAGLLLLPKLTLTGLLST